MKKLEDKYRCLTEEEAERERMIMESWEERQERRPKPFSQGCGYVPENDAYKA